jgi:hypothetical protein
MRALYVGLVAALLTGCASTPPPAMNPQQYQQFASEWVVLQRCIDQGNISPEQGSRGQAYFVGSLNNFSFSKLAVVHAVEQQEASFKEVPKVACNRMAVSIAEYTRQVEINNSIAAQDRDDMNRALNQINQSKPVFCNQVGNLTLCN